MKILIAGGSGFLGVALTKKLLALNYQVDWLSSSNSTYNNDTHQNRTHEGNTDKDNTVNDNAYQVTVYSYEELHSLKDYDVVVNLAGAGIADKPWSKKRKQLLHDSRILVTQELVTWMNQLQQKPQLFISGSAIGWYGSQTATQLTESSAANKTEYQHILCEQWEQSAKEIDESIRTCIIRTGVVLDPSGGMLKKIKTPFSLGLGGNLGAGQQYFSWISLSDWVNAVCFLINQKQLSGVFNLTAPTALTNANFTKQFAQALKRPAFMHVPAVVLSTLMGEMSCLLIKGQNVYPKNLLDAGYVFEHTKLQDAMAVFFNHNG